MIVASSAGLDVYHTDTTIKVKKSRALNGTPPQSYEALLAIMGSHTVTCHL